MKKKKIPLSIKIAKKPELEVHIKGKIKLDKLLLITNEFKNKILGQNQNYVDLFFMNKKLLDVYQVESMLDPASDLCASYTTKEFDNVEGALNPLSILKTDSSYQIKVLKVEDSKHKIFVLKRCWVSFKNLSNKLEEEEMVDVAKFLINKYTELGVNKLYNACPYSAKPAGYHIIHLTYQITKQTMLITEMLSIFAGYPLSGFIPHLNKSLTILDYFIQVLNAGNFLEAYKIEHNDIKPDNFLLEFIDNDSNPENLYKEFQDKLALIKLIDFDIGANQPQDLPTNKGLGCRGFTAGYVAPEILMIIQSGRNSEVQKQMLSQLNPWKSHTYSIGILMLEMIRFIPNVMPLQEFDPLKMKEEDHNHILSKLNEYTVNVSDLILKNIIYLISLCILFNPEDRASVKEILTLIENIDKKEMAFIEKEWKGINEKREPSRTKLKAKIEELNNQMNHLQGHNSYLMEERNTLIQTLNGQFPDANISLNDNLTVKTKDIINKVINSFGMQRNVLENEIIQLKNAFEKSGKENRELFNQNAFIQNHFDIRAKELKEYKEISAQKDAHIQALNLKVQENEDHIKIQGNKIKEKEIEDGKLKKEVNNLKLKIKQYEATIKILTDEGALYQRQLLEKNHSIEVSIKEINFIKENLSTEIIKSNDYIAEINQNKKVIKDQKENISKLEDEKAQKGASFQSSFSKFNDFTSSILNIIKKKGFEILNQNDPSEEILEILKNFLFEVKQENENSCKICEKAQNYEDMKSCIFSSPELNKEVIQQIKQHIEVWDFYNSNFKIDEMKVLRPLISISTQLRFIGLGRNSDFNVKCLEILIYGIKSNQSLKGIALFHNHYDIKIEDYLNILEITKTKKNLICLYLDKQIMSKEKAGNLKKQYKMEINQWGKN